MSDPNQAVAGRLGRKEFITLVAALIAINAFAIDIMLPGLQMIGESLGEADPNRRQLVIPAYMLGFGVLQLVFGPLADRFGRRKPMLLGLAIYAVAALSAFAVTDFHSLIILRFLQGAGAAASAVIAVAVVRDTFVGDQMAKVLSLIFMVMMVSPIIAPSLGQALLTIMDWRGLFGFMAGFGGLVAIWVWYRLPETLKPEDRRPFTFGAIVEGFGIVFGNRVSLSYIMATALLFGALMGFLASSQQIYVEHYGVGHWFPAFFAAGGICAAVGGFLNAQAVTRYGMRWLSHRALVAFGLLSVIALLLGLAQALPLYVFFILMCALFVSFNFIMSNFGALAMMPLGAVAGTAASTQGFLQMVIGASLGAVIGQFYDGTTVPLMAGFVVLTLLSGLVIFFGVGKATVTEGGAAPATPTHM
ncbi:MAG: multidrug effflux MFS transporter [Proteobacteria bacterium]|nr:multidrug effflux MFS transporter [Pseudomonadota bacterium]